VKSFRILVVEDNQDLLDLIVKYLELCGWRASAANRQEGFWLQLERQRPNLILLDVTMQGSEASSLLVELKGNSRFTDIPVIAMTALGSMREKNLCIAAGCDKVLAKPFHLDELRRLVQCFDNHQKNEQKTGGITMRKPRRHFAAVALLAVALSGCQAMTGRTAGQNIDDARISTAVQATLTSDKASNFTRIDVDTTNGVVYLNGTVQSAEQKARAEQLAGRVDGVKKVVNNLQLGKS
jgi:hyperosmotically inducible periplasmic protein